MRQSRFRAEMIVRLLREHEACGLPVNSFMKCRGVTRQTFYRWRKKYGGLTEDSLAEAGVLLEQFQQRYNAERPHSSLGYRTPAEVGRHRAPIPTASALTHDPMAALAVTTPWVGEWGQATTTIPPRRTRPGRISTGALPNEFSIRR